MTHLFAGLMLLAATAVPAHADPAALKLPPGTRVRLFVDDGQPRKVEGRLKDADGAAVTIETGGGRSERFSRNALRGVHYRTGGRDRGKAAGIGGAITGVAGFFACLAAWEREADRTHGPDRGNGQGAGLVCGLAGMVAAVPGAAIGFAIGTTGGEWHGTTPTGFTTAGAGPPRRATVAVRLRFGR